VKNYPRSTISCFELDVKFSVRTCQPSGEAPVARGPTFGLEGQLNFRGAARAPPDRFSRAGAPLGGRRRRQRDYFQASFPLWIQALDSAFRNADRPEIDAAKVCCSAEVEKKTALRKKALSAAAAVHSRPALVFLWVVFYPQGTGHAQCGDRLGRS